MDMESGATLKGVKGVENYTWRQVANTMNRNMTIQGPQRSLIFAEDVDGLIIAGGGIIVATLMMQIAGVEPSIGLPIYIMIDLMTDGIVTGGNIYCLMFETYYFSKKKALDKAKK